jgi:methylated-DNA-[protein]-cysteine S-methyltransferase
MTIHARVIDTPVGALLALVEPDGALVALPFVGDRPAASLAANASPTGADILWREDTAMPVERQLREYFDGQRRTFTLDLRPRGTDFQQLVWRALSDVPFGDTVSYGELARRVGGRSSARAVGRANATNPIPVIVPCHRVIGANGDLTGYGGGMARKEYLLVHEGALQPSLRL